MAHETRNKRRVEEQKMSEKIAAFLTAAALAEELGLSPDHLARLRMEGGGPRFIKLSPGRTGQVRYRREDVEKWLAARTFTNTSTAMCDRSFEADGR
jgi:predicted DNA-binding transcriptional regulator AlpA